MKLPAFVKPHAIATEFVAVALAAILFAYLRRNSPTLRAWLDTTPNP